jgi:hypothetical protein
MWWGGGGVGFAEKNGDEVDDLEGEAWQVRKMRKERWPHHITLNSFGLVSRLPTGLRPLLPSQRPNIPAQIHGFCIHFFAP